MKKQNIIFILLCFLLCALFLKERIRSLPELALDSFEKLCSSPFFIEVFDVEKEEAVAVFGDDLAAEFV